MVAANNGIARRDAIRRVSEHAGALFTTPGTGFLQTPFVPQFLAINPTYG